MTDKWSSTYSCRGRLCGALHRASTSARWARPQAAAQPPGQVLFPEKPAHSGGLSYIDHCQSFHVLLGEFGGVFDEGPSVLNTELYLCLPFHSPPPWSQPHHLTFAFSPVICQTFTCTFYEGVTPTKIKDPVPVPCGEGPRRGGRGRHK